MDTQNIVVLSVKVPEPLRTEFRRQCKRHGRTVEWMLNAVLGAWVTAQRSVEDLQGVVPDRLSGAAADVGGCAPAGSSGATERTAGGGATVPAAVSASPPAIERARTQDALEQLMRADPSRPKTFEEF